MTVKHQLPLIRCQQRLRCALMIAAVFLCAIANISPLKAASAVATGINPKNGRPSFGYWKGGATEKEARERALHFCVSMGYVNSKVIDSTSRRGYGAVVSFTTADKTIHWAVSLAAPTAQEATRIALRNAKKAGGRTAIVEMTWNDAVIGARDVIKL